VADIFDKDSKRILRSVNTPDYLEGGRWYVADRFIINPPFVPDCEPKYIVVEFDDTIREMTVDEKAVVDYVAPPPEPTPEQIEETRKANIREEIAITYSLTDELQIIRKALAALLPDDVNVQAWNDAVVAAKLKYPEVVESV